MSPFRGLPMLDRVVLCEVRLSLGPDGVCRSSVSQIAIATHKRASIVRSSLQRLLRRGILHGQEGALVILSADPPEDPEVPIAS